MKNLKKTTRVEVIDRHGRSYVQTGCDSVGMSFQDDGQTLKIFIDSPSRPNVVYEYLIESPDGVKTLYMTEREMEMYEKDLESATVLRKMIAPDSFQK